MTEVAVPRELQRRSRFSGPRHFRRLQRRTLIQPERLTYSSRGQVPPRRDAAHGNPNTRSIRP
ncbi:MAG: hypothetical protein V3W34_05515, partial [Phycisphaerae bacterium]